MKPILYLMSFVLGCAISAQADPSCPKPEEFAAESAQVEQLKATTVVRSEKVHCIIQKGTCRKLVLLSDKQGRHVPSFYMVFSAIDLDRQSGATEYVIANGDGTFRAFLDENFNGKVDITSAHADNRRLKVTFGTDGLPTIHNARLARHGSTIFAIASLSFGEEISILKGTQFDPDGGTPPKAIELRYVRTTSLEPVATGR